MLKPVFTLLSIVFLSVNLMAQNCTPVEIQKVEPALNGVQSIHLAFNETEPYEQVIEDDDGFLRLYLAWAIVAQRGYEDIHVESVKESLGTLVANFLKRLEHHHFKLTRTLNTNLHHISTVKSHKKKIENTKDLLTYLNTTQVNTVLELIAVTSTIGKYLNLYKRDHVYKTPHYILGLFSFYSVKQSASQIFKNVEPARKRLLLSGVDNIPCVKALNQQVAYSLLDDVFSTESVFAEAQ